jgi:class 3 adenylate cyclase
VKDVRPHLVLPSGDIFFLEGNTSIGRSEQCSIRLEGPKVSRDHTHIYVIGGKFQVVDSQSRNGTYLNELRLRRPTTLRSGDRISVGGHELTFQDGSAPAAKVTTVPTSEMTMEALIQLPTWLLLADIKNSSRLAQDMGLEAYSCLLVRWFDRCRQIIEEYGGTINKSTGDGLLAYWKDADKRAAKHVAQCLFQLKEIQREANPEFRIVVHHGTVGFGGGGAIGEEQLNGSDVHFIFRMEKALGETGHDLGGTPATVQFLQPWIKNEAVGDFAVKGFEGDHALFRLLLDDKEFPADNS